MPKRRKKTIWLTTDYIKAAAAESPEAALACSIKHYRQMKGATAKELREGPCEARPYRGYCSLCLCCDLTGNCVLGCGPSKTTIGAGPCCGEYYPVSTAFHLWLMGKAPIAPFRAAAGVLIAKMVKIQKGAKT